MIFIGFIYILFKVFWVAQGVLSLAPPYCLILQREIHES